MHGRWFRKPSKGGKGKGRGKGAGAHYAEYPGNSGFYGKGKKGKKGGKKGFKGKTPSSAKEKANSPFRTRTQQSNVATEEPAQVQSLVAEESWSDAEWQS